MNKKIFGYSTLFTIFVVLTTLGIILSQNGIARANDRKAPDGAPQNILPGLNDPALPPVDKVRLLVENASRIINQPGWVYLKTIQVSDTDLENFGVLPDGSVIPESYVMENWFHINEDGLVYEMIGMMKTLEGEIVQISAAANSKTWNSAFEGFEGEETPFFPKSLGGMDGRFLRNLEEQVEKFQQQPELVMETVNGNLLVTVSYSQIQEWPQLKENYKNWQIAQYKELPISNTVTAVFDAATGFNIKTESVLTFEDGSQRVLYSSKKYIETGIQPPAGMLKYLEKVK